MHKLNRLLLVLLLASLFLLVFAAGCNAPGDIWKASDNVAPPTGDEVFIDEDNAYFWEARYCALSGADNCNGPAGLLRRSRIDRGGNVGCPIELEVVTGSNPRGMPDTGREYLNKETCNIWLAHDNEFWSLEEISFTVAGLLASMWLAWAFYNAQQDLRFGLHYQVLFGFPWWELFFALLFGIMLGLSILGTVFIPIGLP